MDMNKMGEERREEDKVRKVSRNQFWQNFAGHGKETTKQDKGCWFS